MTFCIADTFLGSHAVMGKRTLFDAFGFVADVPGSFFAL